MVMLFRLFSYILLGESMKIECISFDSFLIFFNVCYLGDIEYNKEQLIGVVKRLLVKIQKIILLQGFYKIKVYVHKKVGLFLDLLKLEGLEYGNSLDFKILIFLDEKMYFKTKDYFLLPKNANIYYYDEFFYCDVDDIDDILKVVEFGEFVFGKKLYDVMCQWKIV